MTHDSSFSSDITFSFENETYTIAENSQSISACVVAGIDIGHGLSLSLDITVVNGSAESKITQTISRQSHLITYLSLLYILQMVLTSLSHW